MTNKLQEYLLGNRFPFSDNELNEVILMIYNLIEWGVRDQTPIIEVSTRKINRKKEENGNVFKTLLTPVDFRQTFEIILAQDEVIYQHLKLLNKTETQTIYFIVIDHLSDDK